MKRIGEPWAPGRPYRDRPGAYVMALREGRILAVWQADELQLPGGGIDPGESPIRALHREVREETGWLIADPMRLGAFQRYAWLWDYGYWARKVQAIYLARAVRRLGPPTEAGHVPVWLSPADAQRHLHIEGDREMVRTARSRGLI